MTSLYLSTVLERSEDPNDQHYMAGPPNSQQRKNWATSMAIVCAEMKEEEGMRIRELGAREARASKEGRIHDKEIEYWFRGLQDFASQHKIYAERKSGGGQQLKEEKEELRAKLKEDKKEVMRKGRDLLARYNFSSKSESGGGQQLISPVRLRENSANDVEFKQRICLFKFRFTESTIRVEKIDSPTVGPGGDAATGDLVTQFQGSNATEINANQHPAMAAAPMSPSSPATMTTDTLYESEQSPLNKTTSSDLVKMHSGVTTGRKRVLPANLFYSTPSVAGKVTSRNGSDEMSTMPPIKRQKKYSTTVIGSSSRSVPSTATQVESKANKEKSLIIVLKVTFVPKEGKGKEVVRDFDYGHAIEEEESDAEEFSDLVSSVHHNTWTAINKDWPTGLDLNSDNISYLTRKSPKKATFTKGSRSCPVTFAKPQEAVDQTRKMRIKMVGMKIFGGSWSGGRNEAEGNENCDMNTGFGEASIEGKDADEMTGVEIGGVAFDDDEN